MDESKVKTLAGFLKWNGLSRKEITKGDISNRLPCCSEPFRISRIAYPSVRVVLHRIQAERKTSPKIMETVETLLHCFLTDI